MALISLDLQLQWIPVATPGYINPASLSPEISQTCPGAFPPLSAVASWDECIPDICYITNKPLNMLLPVELRSYNEVKAKHRSRENMNLQQANGAFQWTF